MIGRDGNINSFLVHLSLFHSLLFLFTNFEYDSDHESNFEVNGVRVDIFEEGKLDSVVQHMYAPLSFSFPLLL